MKQIELSNPQYTEQETPNAKKAIATAMVLDDVAIGLAIVGARGLMGIGRDIGSMAGRFGRKGAISVALAGAITLGSWGTAHATTSESKYGLNPEVQAKLSQLQTVAEKENIHFRVTQGYRSQAQQEELYAQGRTKPGKKVTWTRSSKHTSRNAFDIAVTKGGKVSWDPGDYNRIGEIGESIGLTWGGRWKGRDLAHFQASESVPGLRTSSSDASRVREVTDYIAGMTESTAEGKKNVSDLLFETAAQESGGFKHVKQIGGKGRAVSIFQIEPVTAQNLVKWASTRPKAMSLLTTTSGLTAKELTSLSRDQLSDYLLKQEKFAAAMARVKYMSVPGKIPSSREARAAYWSKWYQGTNNPVKQQQYLANSRLISEEVKATALSGVVRKNISVKPTQGLVNKVLHDNKVMHKVASKSKKASLMWKIFGRR